MAEALAVGIVGPWLTAKAIEKLADYFLDGAEGVVFGWCKSFQKLTSSIEYRTVVPGMHGGLREGMAALTASISAVHASRMEGTETVLHQLVALRQSQRCDQQLAYLKTAVDALEDVSGRRYAKGNPKNVGLLEEAYKNAELAARTPYGSLATRLQAYRIWVVTSYMHEVMTRTSKDAKEEAMYIVGRVIFSDPDMLKICSIYVGCNGVVDEPLREESEETENTTAQSPRTGEPGAPGELSSVDAPIVIEFFLEIMSSVIMLPPLDQHVSCKRIIEVTGAGMNVSENGQMELVGGGVILGRGAPEEVVQAMGKYCAGRRDTAQMYPTVSALACSAWDEIKERLALDNFFKSTRGENWNLNHGWMDKGGELRHRYGVAVEDGHVTKLCLATNNLHGCIQHDLADCEHLRELVVHDNNICRAIPQRVRHLVGSNPNLIVTGISGLRVTEGEEATGSSLVARKSIDGSDTRSVSGNERLPGANPTRRNRKGNSFIKKIMSLNK